MKKLLLYFGLFTTLNPFLFAYEKEEKNIENSQYERIIDKAEKLISKKEIENCFDKMAKEITEKLADKNPTVLCVLSGAIVPTGQLLTRLDFPLKLDYMHATRYRGKVRGTDLKFLATPRDPLKDKVILIVDDIIDSGKTMKAIVDYCYKEGAKEVYTAAMIDKKEGREDGGLYRADFVGLEIPKKFIIGYGLDYEEYFRNLDGIYVMPEKELF